MTPALARRQNQAVPATPEAAAARFKCEAYLCTMEGTKCRDQHVHAAEFRPMNRDACIDCPAGQARAKLLGTGAATSASTCTARTGAGHPCANPPVDGGLCHTHRGAAASKTRDAVRLGRETRMSGKPKKADPPPKSKPKQAKDVGRAVPVVTAGEPMVFTWVPEAPPAVETPVDAPAVCETATPATCRRADCARPANIRARMPEYCVPCSNTAYVTLRKRTGVVPSDAERRLWLETTPVSLRLRSILAKARGEVVPVPAASSATTRPAPPGSKGIDWDAEPLGMESDSSIAARLGCSATAARFQRKKRGIPPFIPEKSVTTEDMERASGHPGDASDPAVRLQFNRDGVLRRPSKSATPDELPVPAPVEVEVAAVEAVEAVEAVPPDAGANATGCDLAIVTFEINGRAFARLQAMAALGIYGDDPNDVARCAVFGWLQGFVWGDP